MPRARDTSLETGHVTGGESVSHERFSLSFQEIVSWSPGRATQNHPSSFPGQCGRRNSVMILESRSEASHRLKLKLPQKKAEQTEGRNLLVFRNLRATASNPPELLPTSEFSLYELINPHRHLGQFERNFL